MKNLIRIIWRHCPSTLLLVSTLLLNHCHKTDTETSIYIPDRNFEKALLHLGVDTDKNGKISQQEAEAVNSLDLSKLGIWDLTGIEHFPNLDSLKCDYNNLSNLNLAKNIKLTYLKCDYNRLTTLDLSQNNFLAVLTCDNNELRELDISKCYNLWDLSCQNNQLEQLELSNNTMLIYLHCSSNRLSSLDVTKNEQLQNLSFRDNNIETIDLTYNSKLVNIDCNNNKLTSLTIVSSYSIFCINNNLLQLDVTKCGNLLFLNCGNYNIGSPNKNQLSYLDISKNTKLQFLGITDMPTLTRVCVADLPFPTANIVIHSDGSPNVNFSDVCNE